MPKAIAQHMARALGKTSYTKEDVAVARHLLIDFSDQDIHGAITYVFEKDENHFWLDKITGMDDLARYMGTLQKRVIGYRQKYRADKASVEARNLEAQIDADPRLSQMYDLKATARRELVEKFSCPDCHGTGRPEGRLPSCPTCYDECIRIYNRLFQEREDVRKSTK